MRPEQLTEMRDGGQSRGGERLSSEAVLLMGAAASRNDRPDRASQGNADKLGLPGLTIGGCERGGPGCESIAGWKPASRESAQGRAWQRLDEQQKGKPLEIGPDGTYQVRKGDCLSRIAERSLQGQGNKQPNKAEIQDQMKRIMEANPGLKCNPDFVREGDRLKIPGNKNEKPVPKEPARGPSDREPAKPTCPSEVPPVRRPEPPNCKPNTPSEVPIDPSIVKPEPRMPWVWPPEAPSVLEPKKPQFKPDVELPGKPACLPERKPFFSYDELRIMMKGTDSMSSELSGVIGYENVPYSDNKVKR